MGFATLCVAVIPVSILVGVLRDRSLHRRSRFNLRLAGFLICMVVPWTVALVAPVGDGMAVMLLLIGLAWALVLLALGPLLLFGGADPGPGASDDGGPGRGPEGDPDPPSPHRPIDGIPLPDAEPSATRVRGPHPPSRPTPARRPAHQPARRPVRHPL